MSQSFLLLAGMLMPVWHQTFDVYPKKVPVHGGSPEFR